MFAARELWLLAEETETLLKAETETNAIRANTMIVFIKILLELPTMLVKNSSLSRRGLKANAVKASAQAVHAQLSSPAFAGEKIQH
ncbi:hypothetical protein Bpro_5504 (plasmid) [Polaromonas sp. JS666]|nr:hypothetical protein Bpro_5504 [Polaromonas sp. JS666]